MIRTSCRRPGLVPIIALASGAGLQGLADQHLSVPTDMGSNAVLKVSSLVAGMVAGADCIGDMALLRHGGMGRVFANAYAPSTLGSFLRSFTATRGPRAQRTAGHRLHSQCAPVVVAQRRPNLSEVLGGTPSDLGRCPGSDKRVRRWV